MCKNAVFKVSKQFSVLCVGVGGQLGTLSGQHVLSVCQSYWPQSLPSLWLSVL